MLGFGGTPSDGSAFQQDVLCSVEYCPRSQCTGHDPQVKRSRSSWCCRSSLRSRPSHSATQASSLASSSDALVELGEVQHLTEWSMTSFMLSLFA